MADKIERDHWHPAFVGAMEIEFIQYKGLLEFDEEHQLSREPLRMDLLVIKKDEATEVTNEIGRLFRQYNVFEYKSPDDGLTIDDYIKTVGYAYLYKGQGKTVDEIPFDGLTVTLVRGNMPEGLFERIQRLGGTVVEQFPGVFYISGVVNIPTQFVLTSSLDKLLHTSLRLLTKRATEEDAERFIEMASKFTEPGDIHNADAVLQVSVSANREIYENVKRRNPAMCQAMKDLMKDEIQEENQKAVDVSLIAAIKNLMVKCDWDATKAMESMGIPATDQIRYASRL